MKVREFFRRFFTVRRCVSCGDVLEYELRESAFCPACRMKWDAEKVRECPDCFKAVCECSCMPKILSNSGALCAHKVLFYSSSVPIVHNSVMYLKRNRLPRAVSFFAGQMKSVLLSDGELPELNSENAVVTFVPRSRRAISDCGFDQARLLAESLSEKLGIPFVEAIVRRRDGREQKHLSASRRAENAKRLFELAEGAEGLVEGKRVILVDDIITTGAGMAACIAQLRRARARETVCLSLAYSKKEQKRTRK